MGNKHVKNLGGKCGENADFSVFEKDLSGWDTEELGRIYYGWANWTVN